MKSRSFWPAMILLVLILFNIFFTKGFGIEIKDGRLYGAMVDIVRDGSIVMILAVGMTLVIATGCIDLSVGAVMVITGAVTAIFLSKEALPLALVLPISLAVSVIAGVWNGLLVGYLKIQPFVATLILMIGGRGIAQMLTEGKTINFQDRAFEFIGRGYVLGVPFSFILALVIFFVTYIVTRTTVVGLYMEVVGDNERASRLCGIDGRLVKLVAFAFLGLCAGVAGIVYTSNYMYAESFHCGKDKELDAILAVVIGGTALRGGRANLFGSILGALIMESLSKTLRMHGMVYEHTLVIKAAVVIVVCLVQSPKFHEMVGRVFPKRSAT